MDQNTTNADEATGSECANSDSDRDPAEPHGTGSRRLWAQVTIASQNPTVRALTGIGVTGGVGTVLRLRFDLTLLHQLGCTALLAATLMWSLRTIAHTAQGRLRASGLRAFTWLEVVLCGIWAVSFEAGLSHRSNILLMADLLIAWVGSFTVAQASEIVRARLYELHNQDKRYWTGRAWFRLLSTRHDLVNGAMFADNFGRRIKSLNETAKTWLFSGLVHQLLVFGALGALFIVPQQVSAASNSSDRPRTSDVTGVNRKLATPSVTTSQAPNPTSPTTSAAPSPTSSATDSSSTDLPHKTYQGECDGQGQQPGADAEADEQDRFVTLFLGPGAYIAGCAQHTRRSADHACAWEEGDLNGGLMSVAVLGAVGDDALFIGDSAVLVLAMLNNGQCITGSDRALVYSGDIQLMYSASGTSALVRETEYVQGIAAPHELIGPSQTRAWVQAMNDLDEWLWPVLRDPKTLSLLNRFGQPVDASITTTNSGTEQVSVLEDVSGTTTFRGGAALRWDVLNQFAE